MAIWAGAINLEMILGPASLEHKLRLMQKQLLEMTDIPPQIQSKIAMVTKALEQFMTMDPDALESSFAEQDESSSSEKQFSSNPEEIDDIESGVNNAEECSESFDHLEIEHSTRETSFSLEDYEEQYRKLKEQHEEELAEVGKSNDDDYSEDFDEEKSICESEAKLEEALRLEEERRRKNEKILKLEKSWQKLCTNTKTIHKWVRSCEGCFCAIKPSKWRKFSLIFAAEMLCGALSVHARHSFECCSATLPVCETLMRSIKC